MIKGRKHKSETLQTQMISQGLILLGLHLAILFRIVHLVISNDGLILIGSQGTIFYVTLRVKMVFVCVYCYFFGLMILGL